jgi:ribosomal protein S18 acetylase RimI-like enzyme
VAELLQICFSGSLDASARQMLQVVAWASSWGTIPWNLACASGMANREEWTDSVVWMESGRIIANVTLTRRHPETDVWLISNVAVLPEFRRQGIGRQLTQFAVEQARSRGARRLMLQVDEGNPSAFGIYRGLGFREIGRRITWFHPTGILAENLAPRPRVESCRAMLRRPEDWAAEYRLLQEVAPAGLSWNLPLSSDRIRPSFGSALDRWMSGVTEHHLLAWCGDRPSAVLIHTGRYYTWEAILLQQAGTAGRVELPLLKLLLGRMTSGRQGSVDTTEEADPECMTGLGFRRRRALIWMEWTFEAGNTPAGPGIDSALGDDRKENVVYRK